MRQLTIAGSSSAPAPVRGNLLHRKCACSNHANGGECAECAKKKGLLQRKASGNFEASEVPLIVHEVLGSPGQPLDTATRTFFEPRFGHDFSQVRLHTDAKAAESARAVNAVAYTVGRDLVLGAGLYQPKTSEGRRLLAHELAHVIQQSHRASEVPRAIGDPGDRTEREADGAVAQLFQPSNSTPTPDTFRRVISRDTRPAIRRWKIVGNTATSDNESDTLGGLAQKAGAHFNDWKCIKPVSQRTSTLARPPGNFDARYELYVQIGDKFDISNLTAKTGKSMRIYLFDDGTDAKNAAIAKLFYPGSVYSPDADTDIEKNSDGGSKPISDMVIFGHAAGDTMFGSASSFTPKDFDPEKPVQTFALASYGLFPRRCWFTRNATARAVGCESEAWGQDFAAHYLRVGASVITTTKPVRPKCKVATATGGCTSYDGLEFATDFTLGGTTLDGPFWSAAAFHASKYWKTIKGKL